MCDAYLLCKTNRDLNKSELNSTESQNRKIYKYILLSV